MPTMSTEIELKFRIPPARLAALRRAVATRSAVVQPLAAVYVDTAGEHLALARTALRLRREGQQWVQTLKAEGATPMQRFEHNVVVAAVLPDPARAGTATPGAAAPAPPLTNRPALDIHRHDGTDAGAALQRLLASAGQPPLIERFATDVQRTRRVLRRGAALIELALDEGHIHAAGRQVLVCEIEFELLQGPPQALLDEAARWVQRFGLVLDVRSKSERGHLLANGLLRSPPAQARALHLLPKAPLADALAALLANPLGQVLANASQLADWGSGADWADVADVVDAAEVADGAGVQILGGQGSAEHLHELRVGLRRLRSVLSAYGPLYSPLLPSLDAALAPALATLFHQLGPARDADAMAQWLAPALRSAGAPLVDLPTLPGAASASGIHTLLCAPATQQLWLALLGLCHPAPTAAGDPARTAKKPARRLRDALRPPLRALQRQVRQDAAAFDTLSQAARHRLRRRIKRLRCLLALTSALWPAAAVARWLRRLQQAQSPLGALQDTVVAHTAWQAAAAVDGRAWFAVGWLAAHQQALNQPCQQALARLTTTPGVWRKA